MSDTAASVGVIVLAGGFGTRLRGVLRDVPKPMAPVAGKPFVEWVVRYLIRYGFRRIVLSTGYRGEQIEEHFRCSPIADVELICRRENEPLGTAGGARHAAAALHGVQQWLIVNGDSLVLADPRPLLKLMDNESAGAALLGLRMEDASRYGTLHTSENGRLQRFVEKQPGAGTINAGVYAFRADELARIEPGTVASFEHDVFPVLAERGGAYVHRVGADFIDIGTPASLTQAEEFIRSNFDQFAP